MSFFFSLFCHDTEQDVKEICLITKKNVTGNKYSDKKCTKKTNPKIKFWKISSEENRRFISIRNTANATNKHMRSWQINNQLNLTQNYNHFFFFLGRTFPMSMTFSVWPLMMIAMILQFFFLVFLCFWFASFFIFYIIIRTHWPLKMSFNFALWSNLLLNLFVLVFFNTHFNCIQLNMITNYYQCNEIALVLCAWKRFGKIYMWVI